MQRTMAHSYNKGAVSGSFNRSKPTTAHSRFRKGPADKSVDERRLADRSKAQNGNLAIDYLGFFVVGHGERS